MPKHILLALVVLVAYPARVQAGTISNFKSPTEVRELTVNALAEWTLKASDPTGCGGGDCCPDTTANDQCTAAGAPVACCAGEDLGTCNDEACEAFALDVQLNPGGWAPIIEEQYQFDVDWTCSSWAVGNDRSTACTATSGTPIIDVSRIASEIANRRKSP